MILLVKETRGKILGQIFVQQKMENIWKTLKGNEYAHFSVSQRIKFTDPIHNSVSDSSNPFTQKRANSLFLSLFTHTQTICLSNPIFIFVHSVPFNYFISDFSFVSSRRHTHAHTLLIFHSFLLPTISSLLMISLPLPLSVSLFLSLSFSHSLLLSLSFFSVSHFPNLFTHCG